MWDLLGVAEAGTLEIARGWTIFSQILGWGYFLAWSFSFYPQIFLNFRRKSVIGLSFDYAFLNVTGFFAYTVFNCALMFNPWVKNLYVKQYHGSIPVEINDIVFAAHALLMSIIICLQILWYPKGHQTISIAVLCINGILWLVMVLFTWLAFGNAVSWLTSVYMFSYVKMAVTLIKYIPQAWSNFVRKSTEGWSIWGVLLDFTGGMLSFGQQFVDSYTHSDWAILYGNPVKLGLALISVAFDVTFIVQHYVCYPKKKETTYESILDTVQINGSRVGVSGLHTHVRLDD